MPETAAWADKWSHLLLAAEWLTDLVFPPLCWCCDRVDVRSCQDCLRALQAAPLQMTARRADKLDREAATGPHEGKLRSAVHALKYTGYKELADPLAERLIHALRWLDWSFDIILPVPLHSERLRERGYNQSELLAERVAVALSMYCATDFVARVRKTEQQAQRSPAERRSNVEGAFEVVADVAGLRILLVDDVVTSGETLNECASVLRKHGAAAVFGIAVSRGGQS